MTIESQAFRRIARLLLSTDPEDRDQGCLDFRVIWIELEPDEQVALSVLLAHVLRDEDDTDIREEELYALATAAREGGLPAAVRSLVQARGSDGLDENELSSWRAIHRVL